MHNVTADQCKNLTYKYCLLVLNLSKDSELYIDNQAMFQTVPGPWSIVGTYFSIPYLDHLYITKQLENISWYKFIIFWDIIYT
jgi:hypothetical protein